MMDKPFRAVRSPLWCSHFPLCKQHKILSSTRGIHTCFASVTIQDALSALYQNHHADRLVYSACTGLCQYHYHCHYQCHQHHNVIVIISMIISIASFSMVSALSNCIFPMKISFCIANIWDISKILPSVCSPLSRPLDKPNFISLAPIFLKLA